MFYAVSRLIYCLKRTDFWITFTFLRVELHPRLVRVLSASSTIEVLLIQSGMQGWTAHCARGWTHDAGTHPKSICYIINSFSRRQHGG